eukprot:6208451-Pleurochrysis_carterae.AAC.3
MTRVALPASFFTATGKLPTTVQLCGFPFMPAIAFFVGRVFTRSPENGCTCQEQTQSSIKPTCRAPRGKSGSCLPE